jgi:hypothetical protein
MQGVKRHRLRGVAAVLTVVVAVASFSLALPGARGARSPTPTTCRWSPARR